MATDWTYEPPSGEPGDAHGLQRYEQLMDVIRNRVTTRAFDQEFAVPREHHELILDAARHAPSGDLRTGSGELPCLDAGREAADLPRAGRSVQGHLRQDGRRLGQGGEDTRRRTAGHTWGRSAAEKQRRLS